MRLDDRYEQHVPLAAGGMATVYLGKTKGAQGFSRLVAIKRLHAQFAADPAFVRMLLDEARVAARIRHGNVVPILDVVEADDGPAIVMEYVAGASLSELLERGPRVPLPIAAAIASAIGHALHAAHEATDEEGRSLGVVHRDVSPHNVLVGADGTVRLLDFGIAKAIGRSQTTREGQRKGKLAYMAPEQIQDGAASRATDGWSAGVVLWEMLAGKSAFSAENEGAVLHAILTRELARPSDVRPPLDDPREDAQLVALEDVALQAAAKSEGRRYATAEAFAVAVERAVPPAGVAEVARWVAELAGELLAQRKALARDVERAKPATTAGTTAKKRTFAAPIAAALVVVASVGAWRFTRSPALSPATPDRVAAPVPALASSASSTSTSANSTSASTSAPVSAPAATPSLSVPPKVTLVAPPSVVAPPISAKPSVVPGPSSPPPKPGCDPPYTMGPDGAKIFRPECFP